MQVGESEDVGQDGNRFAVCRRTEIGAWRTNPGDLRQTANLSRSPVFKSADGVLAAEAVVNRVA